MGNEKFSSVNCECISSHLEFHIIVGAEEEGYRVSLFACSVDHAVDCGLEDIV